MGFEFMKEKAVRRVDRVGRAISYVLSSLPVYAATVDQNRAFDEACAVIHIPRVGVGITGEMRGRAGQFSRIELLELEKTVRSRVGKADYSIAFIRREAISIPSPSRAHRPTI